MTFVRPGTNCVGISTDSYQLTWGATSAADTPGGWSGAEMGMDPTDESTANASVLIPPSSNVTQETSLMHAVLLVAATTSGSSPTLTVSSRWSVHSPEYGVQFHGRDARKIRQTSTIRAFSDEAQICMRCPCCCGYVPQMHDADTRRFDVDDEAHYIGHR